MNNNMDTQLKKEEKPLKISHYKHLWLSQFLS